jgi:hypothetical protein
MKRTGMAFFIWALMGAAALAQAGTPQPGPDQKKLDIFAGSWTLDGELKPGPMGAGGKISETQKCEWMDGGFFVVCHADFKSSMGNVSGLSVMGFSSEEKTYTYREFNSLGEFTESTGKVDGDSWTWTGEDKMGGMSMKGRFTMKFASTNSYNFTYEMSEDGAKWTTVMDGKATKGK